MCEVFTRGGYLSLKTLTTRAMSPRMTAKLVSPMRIPAIIGSIVMLLCIVVSYLRIRVGIG